jgi:predicted nucleic acid-binding protein
MMVLVDANVLLDVLTDDPDWRSWSEETLLATVGTDDLAINPIIYAELAPAYRTMAELERVVAVAHPQDEILRVGFDTAPDNLATVEIPSVIGRMPAAAELRACGTDLEVNQGPGEPGRV